MNTGLLWFRHDLRLADNPALDTALRECERLVPVYVHAPDEAGSWSPGEASDWWLHHSLDALAKDLQALGSRLITVRGSPVENLLHLADRAGADRVYWNRRYQPSLIAQDKTTKQKLSDAGLLCASFNGSLLYEPWTVKTSSGGPYKVFTAFWKACQRLPRSSEPLAAPQRMPGVPSGLESLKLEDLRLLPRIRWDAGLGKSWTPGENGARKSLVRLLEQALADYAERRDRPDQPGTSRLSPHMHFGEISPGQIVDAINQETVLQRRSGLVRGAEAFVRELGWREFAHHVLYHFPDTPDEPLDPRFQSFAWLRNTDRRLEAWQQGRTGYPIVDAGMRQLWRTGWMHNRVRMIVASFLVKNLRIPWQAGARWFWDTLVDADLANNTMGWQWSAGCGADAAPYFRIFNPMRQGERFDPEGDYVRTWVPELAALPKKFIHQPWTSSSSVLDEYGVELGKDYPWPIVDFRDTRTEALKAFDEIKNRRPKS